MVVNLSKLKSDFRIVTVTMYLTKKYKQAKKGEKMDAGDSAPPTPPLSHCSSLCKVLTPTGPPTRGPTMEEACFPPFFEVI